MRKAILGLLLCGSLCFADTLVLRDGSRHDGMLESSNNDYVVFSEGGMPHRYTRAEVQSVEFNRAGLATNDNSRYNENGYNNSGRYGAQDNSSYNARNENGSYSGPMNAPNGVTIPAGTEIAVRTDAAIDSQNANEGQIFPAEVQQDVVDPSGQVVIPRGAQAELTIRNINNGGTTGSNELALGLDSINVGGNTYRVTTQDVQQEGNSGLGKNKRTGEYVGGGAVLGTLIGAIAGGGKGAAIGAVTGAAAGAGAQVLTRGKSVKVPAESTLRFRLDEPLHLGRP